MLISTRLHVFLFFFSAKTLHDLVFNDSKCLVKFKMIFFEQLLPLIERLLNEGRPTANIVLFGKTFRMKLV